MSKLSAFIRLDYITVKPYLTPKNILIYAALAFFLSTISGNFYSGIGVIVALGTMFASYPFALGEKCNMDALYATLALNRKTVVAGRYLFAFTLDMGAVILWLIVSAAGTLVSNNANLIDEAAKVLWLSIALAALFVAIQAIQLPVYFKLGYSKAKFYSLMPFMVILAVTFIFGFVTKENELISLSDDFLSTLNGGRVIASVIPVLALVLFASYSLSLWFYKKRDF